MIKVKYIYNKFHFAALAILIVFTIIRTIGFTPRILDNSIGSTFNNNNVAIYFKNSWTILTQISSFLYYLNFSTLIQSIIFFILPIIIIYISLFNLLIYLNKNENLSIILSFFIVLFNVSIGSTDYPVMWISTHSFGIYSNFLAFYSITLFIKNKYSYSILISTILIAVHPIVGLYTNCVLYILLFLNRRNVFFKKTFLNGFLIGWIIVLISFVIFKNGMIKINNSSFDSNDLEIYLKYWDYHRTIINYNIYFIVLQIFAIYILYNKLQEDYNFGLYYLFVICILGLFLYLSKSFYLNIPILNRIMISRFSILTSIPSSAIILNFLFYRFSLNRRFTFGSKIMYLSFFLLLILKFTTIYKKEYLRLNNYYSLYSNKNNVLFWNKVKQRSYGNILTCSETSRNVIINTKNNIFLYSESIDFIPYMPYILKDIKDIILNLYGINFYEPPVNTRNLGGLSDLIIKEKFENRSIKEWESLSSQYIFNTIIIPNNWNLKIKNKLKGPLYTAYFIK